jgi:hypothetical protein
MEVPTRRLRPLRRSCDKHTLSLDTLIDIEDLTIGHAILFELRACTRALSRCEKQIIDHATATLKAAG